MVPLEKICRSRVTYDATRDAFIAPKPYPSWTLVKLLVNGQHQQLIQMMVIDILERRHNSLGGDSMSTLKSSAEHLTLNADGSGNDIKFQSNATEVAAIDQAGNLTLSGTVDGVDIAAAGALATNALPKAGGTMTGTIAGFTSTGIDDNATVNKATLSDTALTFTAADLKNSISGTYKLFGANGTAGNANYVTYAFEGDNNTGMFSGTADTLKFATGGSERLIIKMLVRTWALVLQTLKQKWP